MTLRFYSNETEDIRPIAEIVDIDDSFGSQIDKILLMDMDTSVSSKEDELILIKKGGIFEIKIVCNNVFIANTPHDKFLTKKFFRETFGFDFGEDEEKWLPQIKKVSDAMNEIPRDESSFWYYRN